MTRFELKHKNIFRRKPKFIRLHSNEKVSKWLNNQFLRIHSTEVTNFVETVSK